MKNIFTVHTGEMKVSKKNTILKSSAIGSCVVIAAYDLKENIGALLHVMVPGRAPDGYDYQRTRYAQDAIEKMITMMTQLGTTTENIIVCLVGGANVLKRKDDTIGLDNIISIVELLKKIGIKIRAKSVGGTERRSVSLDVENGNIYYSVGDGIEKLLWTATEKNSKKGCVKEDGTK